MVLEFGVSRKGSFLRKYKTVGSFKIGLGVVYRKHRCANRKWLVLIDAKCLLKVGRGKGERGGKRRELKGGTIHE